MVSIFALALTILVHALPAYLALKGPDEKKSEIFIPRTLALTDDDFIFRDSDTSNSTVTKACSDIYDGIGLRHGVTNRVSEIAPNGPAFKWGIKLGDIYHGHTDEGPYRIVTIERHGKKRILKIKRERICQDR